MKIFKKIIAWAILSLILQIGGLFILNNFVFQHTSDFKSTKIEVEKTTGKDINAAIPTNAESINISYKGKYLTYYSDDALYIEDTKTGTKSKVTTEDNGTILYYKWLSERDRLVIAEKVEKDGEDKIQLLTYNPKDSTQTYVTDICRYQNNMEVKKISASVLTGVYYIDIHKGGVKSTVYRIDRNNDISTVNIQANVLGNMEVIPHSDRLVYEDELNNKFFVTSPDKKLNFNTNKNLTLIGIDREDIVYMGELNGDKIVSITYGKVEDEPSTWTTVALPSAVTRNNIYFNDNSQILVNDDLQGCVTNLSTGKKVEYEGKLIQIKEDFIATMNNSGKLSYKSLIDEK